ncbi:MAG: hypothetical protein A2189_09105 [Paenibacillus sp. RIFOXYA1_FULL_44_5]|nr:MAG: hypothetical protein A2189_09105 [Paenibacillus sp. RIFOXYA1_FULL_44_5]
MLHIKGVYHDVNLRGSNGKNRGQNTLVYVTEGEIIYWIENERLKLEKGDILFIPFHLVRAWESPQNESHQKYTVVFSWDNSSLEKTFFDTKSNVLIQTKPRNGAYFEQRFSYLFIQWIRKSPYYKEMSGHILSELLTLIAQQQAEKRAASPKKELLVRKVQDYILNDFRKNLTIEELSNLAGITPNYVTAIFKEVIGTTPIQYLHQIRINTAVTLFEHTQMTVREVAEYLGYCDQAYFNRMFKKWMDASPTHFLNNKKTKTAAMLRSKE